MVGVTKRAVSNGVKRMSIKAIENVMQSPTTLLAQSSEGVTVVATKTIGRKWWS